MLSALRKTLLLGLFVAAIVPMRRARAQTLVFQGPRACDPTVSKGYAWSIRTDISHPYVSFWVASYTLQSPSVGSGFYWTNPRVPTTQPISDTIWAWQQASLKAICWLTDR